MWCNKGLHLLLLDFVQKAEDLSLRCDPSDNAAQLCTSTTQCKAVICRSVRWYTSWNFLCDMNYSYAVVV